MKIIDAHIHTNFVDLKTKKFAEQQGIDFSLKGLRKELHESFVESAIAITTDPDAPTPGEFSLLKKQCTDEPRLRAVCSINPNYTSSKYQKMVEQALKGSCLGIKIYPGYHSVYPSDKRYFPFYQLAAKYNRPVIIHSGDTFGSKYLVKYAHPLAIDEIAVKFPKTTFIIAHLGNPWVRDAAELVYKNENVYADISAFCIGHAHGNDFRRIQQDIRWALDYSGRPDKFLYGSDWPLAPMKEYIAVIKKAVPKEHHKKVFYENAKRVFHL